eukprot:6953809-Heterocapsa_arctica.AAC.1
MMSPWDIGKDHRTLANLFARKRWIGPGKPRLPRRLGLKKGPCKEKGRKCHSPTEGRTCGAARGRKVRH